MPQTIALHEFQLYELTAEALRPVTQQETLRLNLANAVSTADRLALVRLALAHGVIEEVDIPAYLDEAEQAQLKAEIGLDLAAAKLAAESNELITETLNPLSPANILQAILADACENLPITAGLSVDLPVDAEIASALLALEPAVLHARFYQILKQCQSQTEGQGESVKLPQEDFQRVLNILTAIQEDTTGEVHEIQFKANGEIHFPNITVTEVAARQEVA